MRGIAPITKRVLARKKKKKRFAFFMCVSHVAADVECMQWQSMSTAATAAATATTATTMKHTRSV